MNPGIAALISEAERRSRTFRRLVEETDRTDGIVYVHRNRCRYGIGACTDGFALAGPNRLLRIVIDARKSDVEAMASLGHELRHALEVLADPTVTSAAAMHYFFERHGIRMGEHFFETEAAIDVGNAVRAEVRAERCK